MRRRRRSQGGFTLIECMVSITILAIGLLGVSATLTVALLANQKTSDTQLALAIAQATIEEMRSFGFGSVTYADFPATATGSAVPNLSGLHGGTRTITIEDAPGGNSRLKRVLVTVSWRGRNGASSRVRLETFITNRGGHTST